MTKYYTVDDGYGNQLTTGVSEEQIEIVAQDLADMLGHPVYVYCSEDDDDSESRRVRPSSKH
jgi:hypothetical protein